MSLNDVRSPGFVSKLLKVAWLSILLGLVMEILFIFVASGFGKVPAVKAVLADLVQKISWSSLVCFGVALGTAASRLRAPAMGFAGFIAAPLAFNIARALHKSAAQALSVAPAAGGGPSPFILALIKAVEYGVFGYALGLISRKGSAGLLVYVCAGAAIGFIFGGVILSLTISQTPAALPLGALIARGINEFLFPVGCALVIYGAYQLSPKTPNK